MAEGDGGQSDNRYARMLASWAAPRWRGRVIAHAEGVRVAGELREILRRSCSARPHLWRASQAGSPDGRDPLLRMARVHAQFPQIAILPAHDARSWSGLPTFPLTLD